MRTAKVWIGRTGLTIQTKLSRLAAEWTRLMLTSTNSSAELRLPQPPLVAQKLIELCSDANLDIAKLVEVVSLDAALTAKFLRVANSSYYGQRQQVSTLRRATVVLGVNYCKVVALGFQLAGVTEEWKNLPIDLRLVWQGNVLRACLAAKIAAHSKRSHNTCKEEAFLVGLLQDLAVPLMAQAAGDAYATWSGKNGLYSSEETVVCERAKLGQDHASLVGKLFEGWSFPPDLTYALKQHHQRPHPLTPTDRTMALWQIAYWVGAVHFNEDLQTAPVPQDLRELASAMFGLDTADLAKAFFEAIEEYEKLHPIFDGVLPPKTDAAALLWKAQELILELRTKLSTDTTG